MGYDVVLLRQLGTRSRPVLELRIDRRDGVPVSIADCVRVSRAVEARLDAGGGEATPFGGRRYELQVSSPGDARRHRPAAPAVPDAGSDRSGREGSDEQVERSPRAQSGADRAREHTDNGSRDGRFG